MELLIALLLAVAVATFVSAPLRSLPAGLGTTPSGTAGPGSAADDLATLEAAKEAKYREIRDLELDRAAGKIGDRDFAAANAELRAEAIAILDRLDAARSGANVPTSRV